MALRSVITVAISRKMPILIPVLMDVMTVRGGTQKGPWTSSTHDPYKKKYIGILDHIWRWITY